MNLTVIDSEGARRAFEVLETRIEAQTELRTSNVDIQRAAIFAAWVGRMVREPELRARFASLPAAEFDVAHVDMLEPAALATWHASVERDIAMAGESDAMVPADVVEQGKAIKQRMLKLTGYYLEDDPAAMTEIESIRHGQGYIDLASDLFRLAKLYERYEPALARDTKHYLAGDAQDARRVGHQILEHLGPDRGTDAQTWTRASLRAWSLLVSIYDEVSAAGRWLLRHDPDAAAQFASLYAMGRTSARSRQQKAAAGQRDALGDAEATQDRPSA